MKLVLPLVAITAVLTLGGCAASIPAYVAPTGDATTTLEVVKSRTADRLNGAGYAVFTDQDCMDGGQLSWMTWATAQSRQTRIPVGVPVYVHAVIHRSSPYSSSSSCVNLVRFTPATGQAYRAEQVTNGRFCQIEITEVATGRPVDLAKEVAGGPRCEQVLGSRRITGEYN
ncbi:hypothetical protein [Brevundimonas sp. FT23042]|uniref:hypothetical protein n=1 Tax=Brevundimonas sp. FT23042 TaxID=3393749 RepID=UPI003B585C37